MQLPADLKVMVNGSVPAESTGFDLIQTKKLFWGDYMLQGLSLAELYYALSCIKLKVYLLRENEAKCPKLVGQIIT